MIHYLLNIYSYSLRTHERGVIDKRREIPKTCSFLN